jgi:hypothetical protein
MLMLRLGFASKGQDSHSLGARAFLGHQPSGRRIALPEIENPEIEWLQVYN